MKVNILQKCSFQLKFHNFFRIKFMKSAEQTNHWKPLPYVMLTAGKYVQAYIHMYKCML